MAKEVFSEMEKSEQAYFFARNSSIVTQRIAGEIDIFHKIIPN